MKVLVVADVHFDRWTGAGRTPWAHLTPADWAGLDAFFIAGDLTNNPEIRWKHALESLSNYIDPSRVYIVPGNHDYYHFQIDRDDRLAEIAAAEGATFAQKAEISIAGTRFLCCTLWTDFKLHGDHVASQAVALTWMNDYHYIRHAGTGHRKIRPHETARIHEDHRSWLEERLSRPHLGRTIVITHHCPHPDLISAARSDLDPVYGSDMTSMIDRFQPDAWLFGHTHHQVETMQGRTRVKNVSLGYPEQVMIEEEPTLLRRGLIELPAGVF